MPFLRQSTSQVILFGPCLDKTDGVTEETALTLAQADMRLSKDGGAFAQKSAAGNATHDSDGWYSTTLSTTDTATVGELRLNVHQPANMLPVWDKWWVLEEAVYDAIYGASAAGPLQSTVAGRTLDVSAGGEAGIDWANVGSPTTAVDLSGTDIQLCDTVTTLTGHTVQTGDSFARLGAPAGASIAADLVVIDDFVDGIETAVITNAAGVDIAADIIAVKAETALIVADTNELQTDDVPGLIAALNDLAASDVLTTQMTEAYAADGTAPTIAQALHLIISVLTEFAISGTTLTAKKLDGSTTAATFTLDDSTNPTSLTRAS